jgi:hypothetical protein
MFILKRQDVQLSTIPHPKKDQQVPILKYQGQTFRLINVFQAAQEEEAKSFWRDLTDNRGKACVLLEEPERYSVWGKIHLDQLTAEAAPEPQASSKGEISPAFVQAALLLLQSVYMDIEDMLGGRQLNIFHKEITAVFQQGRFPQTESADAINQILKVDPLESLQVPSWREQHLNLLLKELHGLGKKHFGNANFTRRVMESLQDMPSHDRNQFLGWLKQSPLGTLWQ